MKHLCLLALFMSLSLNVRAHAENDSMSDLYKAAYNGMNLFIHVVDLGCNNGDYAGWRIKQYDKTYQNCVNAEYRRILNTIAPGKDLEAKNLYTENTLLEELIKEEALLLAGIPLIKDEYGRRVMDLNDKRITVKKLENASNLILVLVM